MKRFHVHVAVSDLEPSIRFYSALFGGEPSVRKTDYAKWTLDDPRVNFAISLRGGTAGVKPPTSIFARFRSGRNRGSALPPRRLQEAG